MKTEKLQKRIKEPPVPENGSQFAVEFFTGEKMGLFSQEKKAGIFQASTFFWGLVVYVSNLYENLSLFGVYL